MAETEQTEHGSLSSLAKNYLSGLEDSPLYVPIDSEGINGSFWVNADESEQATDPRVLGYIEELWDAKLLERIPVSEDVKYKPTTPAERVVPVQGAHIS